jgi:ParB-like chromosome segregation protein Spo0J
MTISNEVPVDQCASLDCHPICREYDNFTKFEYDRLREDIRTNGLLVPILIWKGKIVDGRHRFKVCREIGNPLKIEDITTACPSEEMMRARVASLNQHRRSRTAPLTNKEKRARVEAVLRADPARSNVAIAEEIGVTAPFVLSIRKALESKGVVTVTSPKERKSRSGTRGQGARRTTTARNKEYVEKALKHSAQSEVNTDAGAPAAKDTGLAAQLTSLDSAIARSAGQDGKAEPTETAAESTQPQTSQEPQPSPEPSPADPAANAAPEAGKAQENESGAAANAAPEPNGSAAPQAPQQPPAETPKDRVRLSQRTWCGSICRTRRSSRPPRRHRRRRRSQPRKFMVRTISTRS